MHKKNVFILHMPKKGPRSWRGRPVQKITQIPKTRLFFFSCYLNPGVFFPDKLLKKTCFFFQIGEFLNLSSQKAKLFGQKNEKPLVLP